MPAHPRGRPLSRGGAARADQGGCGGERQAAGGARRQDSGQDEPRLEEGPADAGDDPGAVRLELPHEGRAAAEGGLGGGHRQGRQEDPSGAEPQDGHGSPRQRLRADGRLPPCGLHHQGAAAEACCRAAQRCPEAEGHRGGRALRVDHAAGQQGHLPHRGLRAALHGGPQGGGEGLGPRSREALLCLVHVGRPGLLILERLARRNLRNANAGASMHR
mmetsp:Transcript_80465/g.181570  ORF Transcript_80465/g.181570 Transcript_80465/m.181570 type:complete len:217 (-) Transcript_80465:17-667(-)